MRDARCRMRDTGDRMQATGCRGGMRDERETVGRFDFAHRRLSGGGERGARLANPSLMLAANASRLSDRTIKPLWPVDRVRVCEIQHPAIVGESEQLGPSQEIRSPFNAHHRDVCGINGN